MSDTPLRFPRTARVLTALALAASALTFVSAVAPAPALAAWQGQTCSGGVDGTCTLEFTAVGDHNWTVPAGVTSATFTVDGAQGQGAGGGLNGTGGRGAQVAGTLSGLSAGSSYTILVGGSGGGGYPGYYSARGGGFSSVAAPGPAYLIVAGGGGGGGSGDGGSALQGGSGGGGGLVGEQGTAAALGAQGGAGGMANGGGAGGAGVCPAANGTAGGHLYGGGGEFGGGGGGSGWYGGGQGGAMLVCNGAAAAGGGGGGSSHADASLTGVSYGTGVRTGNGRVEVTYDNPVHAGDAAYSMESGSTITDAVPATGPTGLTTHVASDPSHGSLDLGSGGAFTYTPATDYAGTDSFTYAAASTDGDYAVGTVTFTIAAADIRQLSVADASVVEGAPGAGTQMEFVVSADQPAPEGGIPFYISTTGAGTADISLDYEGFGGQFVIPAGASEYTFKVPVIGDLDVEPDETFEVAIGSPATPGRSAPSRLAVTVADGSATGTIVNDDQVTPATEVTVTFDSQGGSAVASQVLDAGTAATKPADPTRAGYTFDGWYDAASGGNLWSFGDPVTANLTLYARWIANDPVPVSVTMSFDSQGGSSVADQTLLLGELATQPDDPTRAGFVFDGWYDAPVGGRHWYFASDEVTEDVTLYAQWTGVTLSVTSVAQGGSLTLTGTGFWPGEKVQAVLHSDPLRVGTKVADDTGKVVFTTTVPVDFATGAHRATLTGLRTGRAASAGFDVTGRDNAGALPATGAGAGAPVASGLPEVLLAGLLGLVALLWSRRRSVRS